MAGLLATGCSTHDPAGAAAQASAPPQTQVQQAARAPQRPALRPTEYYAHCDGALSDMGDVLGPVVATQVTQKIPFARQPSREWRDCSGNFLRLSSALATVCPELAPHLVAPPGVAPYVRGANNVVPFEVAARSSRAIARWYHERGRFTPIFYDDAPIVTDVPAQLLAHRAQIRPGAVVWFSRGRPRSVEGIEALFEKTASSSHINHMAVVTEVTHDARGNVIAYKMFHGHGKSADGTPASVTDRQFFEWPARFSANGTRHYPPLGYWSQRLVGVGTLVPAVTR